jgi:hypothetical protein
LVWSRQRHGKWPERTGVRDAVVRPVPVTELPGLPQGVQNVGFSALIAIRSRARRERQLLALTRRAPFRSPPGDEGDGRGEGGGEQKAACGERC